MKKYIAYILSSIIFISSFSCSNKNNNDDIISFMKSIVYIPLESLDVRFCSSISNSVTSKDSIQIIVLFSESECTRCKMKELSLIEEVKIENYNHIPTKYIVPCKKNDIENIYKNFCDFMIDGEIYFDTCNAFISANPHIPANELFHTFVINNDGKVLMVGNPFQNDKMEALFKKIIANEQKKHQDEKGN